MIEAIFKKVNLYTDLVKFEHTVFALPFALSAMILSSGENWPEAVTILWVVMAMVGGRSYAMGLNRIIDQHIDGKNPRTKERALPAGRVKKGEAWLLTLISLLLMIYATVQLPLICILLLPLAIAILTLYSYVKRFSNMAHLVLGLALGSSAIGGWIAVTGELNLESLLFGLAVLFWVAGFDIIYACQDVTFDRKFGLFSIPASWGIENGLKVSRLFHLLTVIILCLTGLLVLDLGSLYWIATAMVSIILLYEQSLVSENDLSRVNEAFFTMNGLISIGFFLLITLDKVLQN